VRERVSRLGDDRVLSGDIEALRDAILSGAIVAAAEREAGPLA
jgi:histidine ammonia-lyase